MSDAYPRQVIWEMEFQAELHALLHDVREADEFVEAAEWVIARDPLSGVQVQDDPPLWIMPMAPVHGSQVSLYYTFDDQTVWFVAIQRM